MEFYENSDSQFVEGELIQPYNGFAKLVKGGYVRAIRTYSGLTRIVRFPISFQMPFTESKLIHIGSNQNGQVSFSDALKTKDDVTVVAKDKVDYSYIPIDNNDALATLFNTADVKKKLDIIISDIVKLVVIKSENKYIKNGFSLNPREIPSWLDGDTKVKISKYFDSIRYNYGIEILQIYNCDFNEPKEITEAETKRKAQEIINKTDLEKAQNDNKITRINAVAKAYEEYIASVYNYNSLYKAYKQFNLSTDQICQLLKRQFTKSNATIVEGVGLDALVGAVLSGFKDYAKKQEETTAIAKSDKIIDSDEVIDVDFQENDDNTNQKKL